MNILLATDGSEFSRAAVEKCCEVANGTEPDTVTVISVYEPVAPIAAEPFAVSAEYCQRMEALAAERAQQAVDRALNVIAEKCRNQRLETRSIVEVGRPAEMILSAAGQMGADLIIMGSHGRGFWGRLTLGSVSDAVVHHAACSVLIVKGQKQ